MAILGWQVTTDEFKAQRWSAIRRAFYIGCTTAFCLVMPSVFVLMGYEGMLVERTSQALLSLAELLAMLYLGAGVIDRSKVLDKIGEGLAKKPTVIVNQAGDDK